MEEEGGGGQAERRKESTAADRTDMNKTNSRKSAVSTTGRKKEGETNQQQDITRVPDM